MEVTKTVRVPVHYALTTHKQSVLSRLMARFTYCVRLFSQLIDEQRPWLEGYGRFTSVDIADVKRTTKLSSAYVQQCRDRALWMWRSYLVQHQEWQRKLKHARGRWREKLLAREPQKPFHRRLNNKIPIRIDARTGIIEPSKRIKIAPYVIRLSTLRKRARVVIPLKPAQYHLELLERGRIVDFQLVKQNGWYYAHVCVKYIVADVPVCAVRGIDLGVTRAAATVLLRPDMRLRREDLLIIRDTRKKHLLDQLNCRISELQRARLWEPLKRLRHKRRNVAAYYDRLGALKIAQLAENECSLVAAGYPKGIKYENYRGNGKRALRRTLQRHFSYERRVRYILEECTERGVRANGVLEAWTSKQCHRCACTDTRRIGQSLFWCHACGLQYNADWNAAINIGLVLLRVALSRRATEGLAYAGDEFAYKRMSPEVRESIVLTGRLQ